VLRWQLQPHFLFNALNTVSTLVLRGDNSGADVAIGRISRYLRSALSQRADRLVSVMDEVADVTQYFAIERLRFGDTLCLHVQVADGAREVRIPALIVQPLVENAIRHGFSPASDPTRIGITVCVHERRLELRVTDPACGNSANGAGAQRTDGFGLRYVRERLRHFYGDDATLTLTSTDTGTVASVDMPIVPVPGPAAQ
jgi:LytS/YehU family sensor histidine kinase